MLTVLMIISLKTWMTTNLLKLNSKKTECMVLGPEVQLQKVGDFLLQVDRCSISPSTEVLNLGVILDSTLSYQPHIESITESAFFHLKNISRLWPSLSDSVAETLIHAFISSRLDYRNGVLLGAPQHSPGQTAACPKLSCQSTHSYKTPAAHQPHPETPPLASSQVLHHLQTAPPHL